MRRDEVNRHKPLLKFNVGTFKNRADRDVELAMTTAFVRTKETTVLATMTMVSTTIRANDILTPTSLRKKVLANLVCIEMTNEREKRVKVRKVKHFEMAVDVTTNTSYIGTF